MMDFNATHINIIVSVASMSYHLIPSACCLYFSYWSSPRMSINSTLSLSNPEVQSDLQLLAAEISYTGMEISGLLGPILAEAVAFGECPHVALPFQAKLMEGVFSLLIILTTFITLWVI
jgi:hypothetical protein